MTRYIADRSLRRLLPGLALLAGIGMLGTDRAAPEQPGDRELLAKYARPPAIPYPEQNQSTQARAELGRVLFFEYAFRTPGLRNTARRAPYAHNGSEKTLADVIELYDMGGRVKRPSLSPEIRPLHLTAAEKSDLLAFLDTLTGTDAPTAIPELPR